MQGLRKIFRVLSILISAMLGGWLFLDAVLNGPGEYQFLVASGMMLFAFWLVVTWFWSPLG